MKILFVNTTEPACGVHQYGESMYQVINANSGSHQIEIVRPNSKEEFLGAVGKSQPQVVIYNWQAGIGGWMSPAPFDLKVKQVLLYHDLEANFAQFDAVLFSDPTMQPHQNWYPIGRPIRGVANHPWYGHEVPVIGINGFIGAWAHIAISQIISEFEKCHIRLHLPFAAYGDAAGDAARASAALVGTYASHDVKVEVNHEFLGWDDLVRWLSHNDINCYLRDPSVTWRGVSSSIDAAMCASRPIAINRCNAFRHMFNCQPSIMVEDRSIREILQTGLSPLVAKYVEYEPSAVAGQVLSILDNLWNSMTQP